jgi:carboxypeptidase Q
MKKNLLVVVGCFISLSLVAQNNDSIMVKRIVDETMTNGTAYENLRRLCKEVGPRLSGSALFIKGAHLTAQMLKDIKVDTVYLQQCMVPHWVRGAKERGDISLKGGKKYQLKLTALGNSVGTGDKGVSSSLVEVNTMQQLHQLGETGIKGKIVFFNFPMNPTYIEVFRAYGESGVSRTRGPAQAARYGAVAVIVRSLSINHDDYPHTGVTVYNDSFPKIPAVAISTNDAEYLSRQMKDGNVIKAFFRTNCRMLPDTIGYNVVGEIRGTEHPEEIITVGGHLDSWDLAEGASDDGTGVMQSMEVLRTLIGAGIKPKRTVRAVFFANEENGGKGAQKYLEMAKLNKEHHLLALETDAGGFTPRGFGLDMKESQKEAILKWKPLFYPYGVYEFSKGGGGSDIGPLKEVGTAMVGLSPDGQRYFDIHHAATDVFERVSRRELLLGAANMTALVWLVSEYGL